MSPTSNCGVSIAAMCPPVSAWCGHGWSRSRGWGRRPRGSGEPVHRHVGQQPVPVHRIVGQVLAGHEPERGRIDVHTDDPVGCRAAHHRADERAVVAALDAVARVASPAISVVSRSSRPPTAGSRNRAGERRDHEVKRLFGNQAMGARVAQRADDVEELHYRTAPAVQQDQRPRGRFGRFDVQEVHRLTVDLGCGTAGRS